MTKYALKLSDRFPAEMTSLRRAVRKLQSRTAGIDSGWPLAVQTATIDPAYKTGLAYVYFTSTGARSVSACSWLASYAPAAGDLVVVAPTPVTAGGGGYVILGRLTS